MLIPPPFEGWKVETIGDDIAWIKFGEDGRLYAINPEPASSASRPAPATRPTRTHGTSTRNSIFTNVALTDDGDVWWEGMTDEPPAHLIDWKARTGRPRSPTGPRPRTRTPLHRAATHNQCPRSPPSGTTRSRRADLAILFGGRRSTTCRW
jgi:phosphoenolpyruvate carboxykinase (GTP)